MNSYLIVATVVSYVICSNGASVLPDWLTPCKGNDPNLNDCAMKEANKVIPTIVKGYPKLNLPVLQPLNIPEIKIDGQLKITLKNALVYGLEETKASDFKIDLKEHSIAFKLLIPNLNIQCQYEVNGQILVLPITGKGPGNITASDGVYSINFSYTLYEKNNVQYAKMKDINVDLDIKRFSIYFDNLFNGNKELGDSTNAAVNKEWRVVLKELEPALKEAIGLVTLQIANGVTHKVPYADIFGGVLP